MTLGAFLTLFIVRQTAFTSLVVKKPRHSKDESEDKRLVRCHILDRELHLTGDTEPGIGNIDLFSASSTDPNLRVLGMYAHQPIFFMMIILLVRRAHHSRVLRLDLRYDFPPCCQ